ncbi:MAG: helix-hairpin-helix domain-containing protein [Myxococcota bacterium]
MTEPPSIAGGALALGAGMLIIASGLILADALISEPLDAPSCCEKPVEIGAGRIGCIGSAELSACGPLKVGDRVEIRNRRCTVRSGEMSAGLRLLLGLGIDINRAPAPDLELLDGIGPALAEAIVVDRQRHGRFQSIADLERVKGIGPATRAKLEPFLTLGAGDDTQERP